MPVRKVHRRRIRLLSVGVTALLTLSLAGCEITTATGYHGGDFYYSGCLSTFFHGRNGKYKDGQTLEYNHDPCEQVGAQVEFYSGTQRYETGWHYHHNYASMVYYTSNASDWSENVNCKRDQTGTYWICDGRHY